MKKKSSIKLIFANGKNIASPIIKFFTWSKWSHVAILDGDYVIQATWPKVNRITLDEFWKKHHKKNHYIASYTCPKPEAGLRWARKQVGKPYDWGALLGFLAHRKWDNDYKWYCAELTNMCKEKAGRVTFRKEAMSRVTPQTEYMLVED